MTTLPSLDVLGPDLIGISRGRQLIALARPVAYFACFCAFAALGLWALALAALLLEFVAVAAVMHDAVHGSVGLRRRGTDWALFAFGALLLVSGHAYRATHQQHHRVFPGPDDPEGDAARWSTIKSLLRGPLHVPRLWWWAFRRARRRGWLLAEGALAPALLAVGALLSVTWCRSPTSCSWALAAGSTRS